MDALALSAPARLGQVWFRYRSFSPLPLFILMLVLPPNFQLGPVNLALALSLVFLGEVIRIWAVGYAGSVTRTRGDGVGKLVHAGPFRYVRNPIYIGNIFLYVGTCIVFGFSYLSILMALYFAVQYSLIVRFEEATLLREYGAEFERYRSLVPRWIPALFAQIHSSEHSFLLGPALRSERSTFIAIAAMAALYLIKLIWLQ